MNETFYLLDNNVLSRMSLAQRATPFVRDACRMPTEVLHEARGFPDIALLKHLEYPTTIGVLRAVQEIMQLVAPGDMSLVNLYDNLGYADPVLFACALDASRESDQYLFGPSWVVVTNDKAVRTMSERVAVTTIDSETFTEVMSSASGGT